MATMNVSLPDEMKKWVEEQVATGRYANSSDFMRDLVRREHERVRGIAWLQAEIDKGRRSGVSDKTIDEVFAEARKKAIAAQKSGDAAA